MRDIRVLGLVPYPPETAPSQRFRIEQWMPYLHQQGIAVELLPFADSSLMRLLHRPGHLGTKAVELTAAFTRRAVDVVKARKFDVVLIHRAVCLGGPAILERALSGMGRPIIFDFDDAIYMLHTTAANRPFGWLKFPRKTGTICRISAHVVVGNAHLAEYAVQHNACVTVIPSSVDTERFRPSERNGSNSRIVVGWMGSSTSQTHLEMFAPVLRRLLARRDIELRIISDREPLLPGIPFVWQPWSAETEVSDLAHFDIGIMPMPDDLWARGKCAMKALLYMAMGVPAICSPVGTNCELIQHGENGLLATTPEDWIDCLEMLIDDARLRETLGMMGRHTVEERYSLKKCAESFALVVRDTVKERRLPVKRSQHSTVTPNSESHDAANITVWPRS